VNALSRSTTSARGKWPLVAGTALFLLALARLFLFGIYEVDSRSMAPTLQGGEGDGESVLVRYGRGDIERFDLVVLRRPGVKEPRVKRVVGLPGEAVQLVLGDLVIDGERLHLTEPRPPLVEVFNDSRDQVDKWFQMGGTEVNPWQESEGGWHLAAEEVPSGAAAGTMFFAKRLTAGHISGDAVAGPGGASAADCVLGCEVRPGETPAELHFILREQGDTFRAELDPGVDGKWSVRVLQRWRGGEELVLAERALSLSEDGWTTIRFGNVDDQIFLELAPEGGELSRLFVESLANHLDPSDRMAAGETYGHRIGFGGAAGSADFRSIRVWRDLHYTDRGTHGKGEPVRLGPNELFVLGDNSPESRDGRDWGPISTGDVLGRPIYVVLPMGAIRPLGEDTLPLIPSGVP
jgi:signal peptidase I